MQADNENASSDSSLAFALLCARHHTSLFNDLGNPASTFIIPVLQIRKLMLREVQ